MRDRPRASSAVDRRASGHGAYARVRPAAYSLARGWTGPRRTRRGAGSCPRRAGPCAPASRVTRGQPRWRPLLMVSVIVASEPPYSQIVSVRFGAPMRLVALAVGAVAGGAVLLEQRLAELRPQPVVRQAGQRAHVGGDVLRRPPSPSAAPSGGMMPIAAVGDRFADRLRRRRRRASRCRAGWESPCCRRRRSRGIARNC